VLAGDFAGDPRADGTVAVADVEANSPPLRSLIAEVAMSTIFSASRPLSNGGLRSTPQNCGLSAGM
jgi:hypothetical protein